MIILRISVLAMLRGLVALTDWELNGRFIFGVSHVTVAVVAVGKPVRVAGFGLVVGERRLVGGRNGIVLADADLALGVGAGPGLCVWSG